MRRGAVGLLCNACGGALFLLAAVCGTLCAPRPFDLLLSSGFLCFSSHCGFLTALETRGLAPSAIVGTSSGALAAAMLAAGLGADEIAKVMSAQRPFSLVRPSIMPWRGPLSTRALTRRMREVLPATFAELEQPLAVGVFRPGARAPLLLTEGDLPHAVVASCAVPNMFSAVSIDGYRYADGGAVDRTMTAAWREWRPEQEALVHLVSRLPPGDFGPRDGVADEDEDVLGVIRTERTGASFFSLKDFEGERAAACEVAGRQFDALGLS